MRPVRARRPTAPALLVTGTVGSGKTTVVHAVSALLRERGIAHAAVDLDELRRAWPRPVDDPFHRELGLRNLGALVAGYRAAGAARLVLAGVVEDRTEVDHHEEVVGPLTVVRLRTKPGTVAARLRSRHVDDPDGLAWHLTRAPELDALLDAADLADAEVDTTGRTPTDVAADVLRVVGW